MNKIIHEMECLQCGYIYTTPMPAPCINCGHKYLIDWGFKKDKE